VALAAGASGAEVATVAGRMVEEGAISAERAAELLAALRGS